MSKTFKIIFFSVLSFFGIIGFISLFVIVFNDTFNFGNSNYFDADLASKFGSFFGGVIGTIFGVISVLLIIYTIINQNYESKKSALEANFFRMIDYHNQNVNQLKISHLDSNRKNDFSEGRRAFVQFKIQIHRLFQLVNQANIDKGFNLNKEEIADIVYIVFYYGIDGSWISFIEDKLSRYANNKIIAKEIQDRININPDYKIGRTNQTNLSTYFRNLYNAVKMIDNSKYLTKNDKKDLIKIYRAQLSNPELYVFFFNVMSRFGKKWKENDYVVRYEIIKNLPKDYCEDYDPKNYFDMDL